MGKKRPLEFDVYRDDVKEVVAYNDDPSYKYLDALFQPPAGEAAAPLAGAASDGYDNLEHAGTSQQPAVELGSDTEDDETDDEQGQDSHTEAAAAARSSSKKSPSSALDSCRPELQQLLMQQLVPNLLLVRNVCAAECVAYELEAKHPGCPCPACGRGVHLSEPQSPARPELDTQQQQQQQQAPPAYQHLQQQWGQDRERQMLSQQQHQQQQQVGLEAVAHGEELQPCMSDAAAEVAQQGLAGPQHVYMEEVQSPGGAPGPAAAGDLTYRQCGAEVVVHVCTLLTVHAISVKAVQCLGCGVAWQVKAPHLGCLPGNSNALQLKRRDLPIIWFSQPLLQHMDALVGVQGSMSTHKYAAALVKQWSANMEAGALRDWDAVHVRQLPAAQPLPFTVDTLERQLGSALREYQYWESRKAVAAEEYIEGWPLSVQRPCAACLPEATHEHFDVCFGLCKHKRSGHDTSYAAPDNRRVMLDNQQVQERMQLVDTLMRQQRQRQAPCSADPPAARAAAGEATAAAALVGLTGAALPAALDTAAVDPPAAAIGRAVVVHTSHVRQLEEAAAAGEAPAAGAAAGAGLDDLSIAVPQPQMQRLGVWDRAATAAEAHSQGGAVVAAGSSSSSSPPGVPGACSQFQADKLMGRDSSKYLITGVAVAACRHGQVCQMLNCFGGERHAYGIVCYLSQLDAGTRLGCFWYDINCRWHASLCKVAAQLGPAISGLVAQCLFPIPPWHAYAHLESCRRQYGPLHMTGAGVGTGEVCERVNSWMASYGIPTQYMHGTNREACLERAVLVRGRDLDERLHLLLLDLTLRTDYQQKGITEDLDKLTSQLREMLAAAAEQAHEPVQQYMERKVAVAAQQLEGSPQQQEMQWPGQFVKALLVLQSGNAAVKEDQRALANSPPLSMLFPTSVASSVSITNKAVAAAWSVIYQVAPEQFREEIDAGRLPGFDHPQMQQGVQEWVRTQVSSAEEQLLTTLSRARWADLLVKQLSTRSGQQGQVIKRKRALWRAAKEVHSQLQQWAKWALLVSQKKVAAACPWPADLLQQLQYICDTPIDKYQTDGCSAAGRSGSAADVAATKVHLLRQKQQRLSEEADMLTKERERLLHVADLRLMLLEGAMQHVEQHGTLPCLAGATEGAGSSASGGAGARASRANSLRYLLLKEHKRITTTAGSARRLFVAVAAGNDVEAVIGDVAISEALEQSPDTAQHDE